MKRFFLCLLCVLMLLPTAAAGADVPTFSSDALSQSDRSRINIFLSNFSEQWFNETTGRSFCAESSTTAGLRQMVDFVCLYHRINKPGTVRYEGASAYLSLQELNASLQRFFGFTVTVTALKTAGYSCTADRLYFAAGGGEAYSNLTVMDGIDYLPNGLMMVTFTIYTASLAHAPGGRITSMDLYNLTGYQASVRSDLTWHRRGSALLQSCTWTTGPGFHLLWYSVD